MSQWSGPAESTVDHADIRGSAEAAFMVMMRRELPLTRHVGLATITTVEESPSPRPARPLTHSLARNGVDVLVSGVESRARPRPRCRWPR
jgi:hypothetical protein